jgi:hypothetical protein
MCPRNMGGARRSAEPELGTLSPLSIHLHLARLVFRALVARLRGGPGRQRTRTSAQDC